MGWMGVNTPVTVGAREVEVGSANLTSLTFGDFCCRILATNFVDFGFFHSFAFHFLTAGVC